MARAKCLQVIKLMPKDHSERPTAQKVLGMVYYFQAQPELAKAAHDEARKRHMSPEQFRDSHWSSSSSSSDVSSPTVVEDDTSNRADLLLRRGSHAKRERGSQDPT